MAVLKLTVKEQIYSELKTRIHNNTYSLGERINIDSLARELEVSNSPVREAVNMLVQDGLLETSPNTGPKVIELNEDDVAELNQAIYVLLVGGYDICLSLGKQDKLVELLNKRLATQKKLLKQNNQVEYIKTAMIFDRSFLDITENDKLIEMYNSLTDLFYLAVAERLRNDTLNHNDNLKEHYQILDAVKNNNRESLVKAMKHHYKQLF